MAFSLPIGLRQALAVFSSFANAEAGVLQVIEAMKGVVQKLLEQWL